MSRKISVVTSFNAAGYQHYASRMIDTFLANWGEKIDLYVYAEDCRVTQQHERLHVIDYHAEVPALVAFKQRYRDDDRATGRRATGPADSKGKQPGIGFRWDAIRFSHKVYAVCDHARRRESDVMYWMDADMVCHTPITHKYVSQQIPENVNVAFLGRERKFSECGLYALNLSLPATLEFVDRFQHAYDDAENGIFQMQEWNDCWVFDRTREHMQANSRPWRELNWSAGLIKGEGHPLINTQWGAYLDHLKGRRKDRGRSAAKDLLRPRSESYWAAA
jgi:hypothetical protein